MRAGLALLLVIAPSVLGAQAAPNECYGFRFGAWDPPLKTVASPYSPGYDPTTGAPAGAPRDWAARVPNGQATNSPADSVLMLFPSWWPVGVEIRWTGQRGDTLVGTAIALVADGRQKNPVTTVRGVRVGCSRPDSARRPGS
jgi:hypothetical protein